MKIQEFEPQDIITHDAWRLDLEATKENGKPTYTTSVKELGEMPLNPWWDELPKRVILWYNDTSYKQVFRYEHNTKSPAGVKVKLLVKNK